MEAGARHEVNSQNVMWTTVGFGIVLSEGNLVAALMGQ